MFARLWLRLRARPQPPPIGPQSVGPRRGGPAATIGTVPSAALRARRHRARRLTDCNTAYATARDTARETALGESRELASESGRDKARALARMAAAGSARSERRHVVIAGSRRLLEVCELPDRAGGTIGFAIDRTDVESAETALARHINAHGQVLESIHAAVAIYGPDKRLSFFNSAFARLWAVHEACPPSHPSLPTPPTRI